MADKKRRAKKPIKVKSKPVAGRQKEGAKKDGSIEKFPIVGIGASAGGLEALKAFFSVVAMDSGMAYIVVVHMTPNQPSMMPDLLQNISSIPVSAAKDGQIIAPNQVYVIPPDKDITIFKGKIQLLELVKKGVSLPIDLFLRSLAQDQGHNAAAVILSGTGTDGTLGVKEIKAKYGLVLVQSEVSAAYNGMPRSAVNTGLVDLILPPEGMPGKLIQYFAHPMMFFDQRSTIPAATNDEQEWLNKIFAILRTQIGHDFSAYKVNTILRRIGRRMGLNHIDNHATYVRFLRENPSEVEALFREMLIGVTNFFRDNESFNILGTDILPALFDPIKDGSTFRAWIPGCSTGEEVYSLAMVLRECLDRIPRQINLQLFGTDIDDYAIDKAREGIFPSSITADVSEERLKRYFIKEGDFFKIRNEVRDSVVFSVQDILKDPPFSHLNLLCCRNLLIYLDASAQKKLLPLFHYTLRPGGVLVLGSSETIGAFSNLFSTLDKKWKIFRRREVPQALRQIVEFPSGLSVPKPADETLPAAPVAKRSEISQLTQQAVLDQFAPTAILTDAKGNILHVLGRTGNYLETPSGPPTNNILDMIREDLHIELSSALRAAKSSTNKVTRKHLPVKTNGKVHMVDLHVAPQKIPQELAGRFLVVFEETQNSPPAEGSGKGVSGALSQQPSRIAELKRELQVTRESHQTIMEELESSNEELKSTNEEMQSSNEELQSTNEEMESSKEELQSLNEELHTVNAELQSKLDELSAVHDDMRNLLNSTEIATIFVDNDLRLRRFTTEATTIVNLIHTDIGRPLKHVVSNLLYAKMITDLDEVITKLTPKEVEVQTADGQWYNMRIRPYRTMDNRIDGAVLTFTAIGDQKEAQDVLRSSIQKIEAARELVGAIFDMYSDPMAVLDRDGHLVIANTGFSALMNLAPEDLSGRELLNLPSSIPEQTNLKAKLKTALKHGKNFTTDNIEIDTAEGKQRFFIQARIIQKDDSFPYRILLQLLKER